MVHPRPTGTWRQFSWDKVVWWMFDWTVPFGTILFLVHCVHLCPQLLELYSNNFSGTVSCFSFMCSYVLTQQNGKRSCCGCQQSKRSETSIGIFLELTVFNTGKQRKHAGSIFNPTVGISAWNFVVFWMFEVATCCSFILCPFWFRKSEPDVQCEDMEVRARRVSIYYELPRAENTGLHCVTQWKGESTSFRLLD